ncbi:hypothetical protein [uncultured Rikenella sp.]|uniref:hypothetical protein n=1 Tax=uncultured Rikenella sp. TaxID=368003 RepID=UPI00261805EC|nr:hypothetical protein [uncultured Rikenella sp.]
MERRARPPNGIFHLRRTEGRETPAPGFRSHADGGQRNVGNEGTVWSATPNGSMHAWRLLFHTTGMDPANSHTRGYGFQLRCLSE